MKNHSRKSFFNARILVALLAATFFIPTIQAQDEPPVSGRYLFIFCTSSEMRPRQKDAQQEIITLLSTAMDGQIKAGDTIGAWTLGKTLRVGQFPLVNWQPANAAKIAAALEKFIGRQRYSGAIDFEKLQPLLDEVVKTSPRLTILIFCDGESEFTVTPYAADINQIFSEHSRESKKSKEPLIIVLRTQQGKYIGASVNFPPGMVNLPRFSPLPQPSPAAAPAPVLAKPPAISPPPLVIIGTRIETNWQAYQFALTNVPENPANAETNEAISNRAASVTNPVAAIQPPKKQNPVETNIVSAVATNSAAMTNAAALPENQKIDRRGLLALAAGFLIGAIALTTWFIFRSRDEGSLISRSMKK